MKRIFLPVVLVLLLAACGAKTCNHVPGPEATCTRAQTCTLCGAVLQPALGHDPVLRDCEEGEVCSRCGAQLSAGKSHTPGPAATCRAAQTCTVCGKVLAPKLAHTPSGDPSCTQDVVCTVCGQVLTPAAHDPGPAATCTDDQLCTRCGAVLTPALGHAAGPEATATAPQTCTRCGAVMALAGDGTGGYVAESVSGNHYHNNLDAYYSGNVLVCGDYALEYFSMDKSGSAAWADAVNQFAASYPKLNVSALLIPKSCAFHAPNGYSNQYDSQAAYISATYAQLRSGIQAVDAASLLAQHSGEYLYYRTDHHWTSLGAYYASVAYCRANGLTPRQLGSYETTVQTGYVGSLYSFCASPHPACLKENPDYTVCHLPKAEYTMTYRNGGGDTAGQALNTETNAYATAFLGGDNALTDIVTNNKTGRKLLIFKESYGNPFAPYMIDYYDEILVVDIRKDTESVGSLIAQYGITDALVINNVQASASLTSDLSAKLRS